MDGDGPERGTEPGLQARPFYFSFFPPRRIPTFVDEFSRSMVQGNARRSTRRAVRMRNSPRTTEKRTGSYVARRRRKRWSALLAVAAICALGALAAVKIGGSGSAGKGAEGKPVAKREILADFTGGRWEETRAKSARSLAAYPLDPFYLTFRGLGAFYAGAQLPEGEQRGALIDESIAFLRKAIASGGKMPLAQAWYVLAKAYYEKGDYYIDESAQFMESAIASGYVAKDSREFLALAYSRLGDHAAAARNFEAALAGDRSAPLLIAAAKAYVDAGTPVKAEALLLEVIAAGGDDVAAESGRFLLGDIYRARSELDRAYEQYSLVLEKNPESAEAYYRIGLVWQARGDAIKARAAWRKAVSIDPMHGASRQKLSEKL